MATNPLYYNAAMTALTTLLNSGTIVIYQGTQPSLNGTPTGTVLATLTFGSTAFTVSSGVATANTITSGTAGNTGTAQYFALVESGGSTVVGTGTCGATSGFDLNLNSTSIVSGASVSCSSFTITG